MNVNIYLFNDFETLDIFGPIEMLGRIDEYELKYYSIDGGIIRSAQGTEVITKAITEADREGIFAIPGGRGTRPLVQDKVQLAVIKKYVESSTYCLSICTGSAVLAVCNVLEGREATSNKKAMDWVKSCGPNVKWNEEARFCKDGKFYTSAGVSAGIDMALGFIADKYGIEKAERIAEDTEYNWNRNYEY